MNTIQTTEMIPCSLELTNNARKGVEQWFLNENAFVSSESSFDIHIEKKPANRQGNQSFALFFDPQTNKKFGKEVAYRVAVLECVLKPDGLVATGFHVRGTREPVQTNRRLHIALKFRLNRVGIALPIAFYTKLKELPIAEERSEYVKKRIESWEGYLQIAEKNADVEDITCAFSRASLSSDFTKLHLHCPNLQTKNWKKLRGFSVKIQDVGSEIGQIIDAQKSQKQLVVELSQRFQKRSRQEHWLPITNKNLVLTNFAELSQIRRLRKGFKDLQEGLAANANLEKVLFEERPVVQINNKLPEIEFHNNLNEFQQEAVAGAMKAHDLYVIQGPPGTGKTTVISEICYQNVKAGLRTLVASQSNLAVDNALGRLLTDPATRILRYGRSESIEEEGKRFIEENVALHWRDETLETARATRLLYQQKAQEMTLRAEQLEQTKQQKRAKEIELTEQLQRQKTVKLTLQEMEKSYALEKNLLEQVTQRLADKQQTITLIEQKNNSLSVERENIQCALSELANAEAVQEQLSELQQQQQWLKNIETYVTLLAQIQQSIERRMPIETTLSTWPNTERIYEVAQRQIEGLTKAHAIQNVLTEHKIELPIHITLQINELQRQIKSIESGEFTYGFQEWKELFERFQTAIEKTEKLMVAQQYPVATIKPRSTENFTTIQEMHDMIDRLGRYLVHPKTKKTLQTKGASTEKTEVLKRIATGMELFYGKIEVVRDKGAAIKHQQVDAVKQLFSEIKKETIHFLNVKKLELQQKKHRLEQQLGVLKKQQQTTERELNDWLQLNDAPQVPLSLQQLAEKMNGFESAIVEQQQQLQKITATSNALKIIQQRLQTTSKQRQEHQQQLLIIEKEQQQMQVQCSQQLIQMSDMKAQIDPTIDSQLKKLASEHQEITEQLQALATEREQLPILQELQQQWEQLLEEANDYDLDEIRKLYVEHANVIGTTCVASASKKFMDEYPVFDVVIIDEVSKATPPELLLPMLKGKKVILVGDHHQLPPLVGQETMDELVEQQKDPDVQREMKKLLNESLFERLFRTLPKQNKTMLSIQYRMHENIMATIAPFYREGNYQLQCGLSNSDEMRDHLLETPTFTRNNHLLWLDTPNTPKFYEDQVKGGTSRFNEAELKIIETTLQELERATELAKAAGRMQSDEKKSVGVISFYGEQVKRIDRLIQQELKPQQLHCRTGSVDKFQGMEMDIIILSFVRNHGDASGDIGFAKDYRRLNVALSRARELLIIVGSSDMFTIQTKNASTRDMYRQLQEVVKSQRGMKMQH